MPDADRGGRRIGRTTVTDAFRAVGAFCGFGKLPSQADFIHAGPSSELFARFNDWLTDGVELAHQSRGAAWDDAFCRGGMRAFMYRSEEPSLERALIVGALTPSQDRAGRLFPMCVAAPVVLSPEFVTCPDLLPLACEPLWQLAGACVAELASSSVTDVAGRIASIQEPSAVQFGDARATYLRWSRELSVGALAEVLTESTQTTGFDDIFCRALARIRERESARGSICFPLGAAGGAAVCFWLDVTRRLLRRAEVPSVFWSNDGKADRLILDFGAPPVSTVSELWPTGEWQGPDRFSTPLSDSDRKPLAPLPMEVERTLREPTCSVAALLQAVGVDC